MSSNNIVQFSCRDSPRIDWQAVRAYSRAAGGMYERQSEDHALDHAVCPDGYGTAGLEAIHRVEERRLAYQIARRFGLSSAALLNMVENAGHIEQFQMMTRGGR